MIDADFYYGYVSGLQRAEKIASKRRFCCDDDSRKHECHASACAAKIVTALRKEITRTNTFRKKKT